MKKGLAGFVRSRRPIVVRVLVAVVAWPIWLTSEIRQSRWSIGGKIAAIATVWAVVVLVPAAAAPPQNDGGIAQGAAASSATPATTSTHAPATPSTAPTATTIARPMPARTVTSRALQQLAVLTVRDESRSGYDRDLFHVWTDADNDGCDTRREVLIAESLDPVTVGAGCTLTGGRWRSAYDGIMTTDASTFDIDHFVPLAEAWDSGADAWPPALRDAYANDMGFGGSLIAVTASSNRSKSDADPTEWRPPLASYACTYAANWVAVKTRWRLSLDTREASSLRTTLAGCPTAASVPAPKVVPAAKATPTATPMKGASANCSASYPDFCIAPPPPDLNCADIGKKNVTVRSDVPNPDPHRFDANHDGVGCEE